MLVEVRSMEGLGLGFGIACATLALEALESDSLHAVLRQSPIEVYECHGVTAKISCCLPKLHRKCVARVEVQRTY